MPSLAHDVELIMERYLNKFKNIQTRSHPVGEGLILRTQAAIQSNPYGKLKFHHGCETVWLMIKMPNHEPIILARLSETKAKELEFEVHHLDEHTELVSKLLPELNKTVS